MKLTEKIKAYNARVQASAETARVSQHETERRAMLVGTATAPRDHRWIGYHRTGTPRGREEAMRELVEARLVAHVRGLYVITETGWAVADRHGLLDDVRDEAACHKGHGWTAENTYFIPAGRRRCRACDMDRARAYRRRNRLVLGR